MVSIFGNDILNCFFLNTNQCILIIIYPKFVDKGQIDNNLELVR